MLYLQLSLIVSSCFEELKGFYVITILLDDCNQVITELDSSQIYPNEGLKLANYGI